MRYFKKQTISDLYVWIVRYWDDLKNKFGDGSISIDKAVADFYRENKKPLLQKAANMVGRILTKRMLSNSHAKSGSETEGKNEKSESENP